jgi:ketosteroid isomerase-like protein
MRRPPFVRTALALAAASCLTSAPPLTGQEQPAPAGPASALDSLVAAERAFAADALARGIRASFLSAFADDGLSFDPRPEHTRAELLKQPEPDAPPQLELDWHPVWADVSAAGDLGYTTGPYVLRDLSPKHRPPRHGYYFSIWKRLNDGSWKVAFDAGTRTPASGDALEPEFRPAPDAGRPLPPLVSRHRAASDALHAREKGLDAALKSRGPIALADYAAPEARLHRDGALPALGKDALRSALASAPTPVEIELLGEGLAASGDLAYTWGHSELADGTSGYFIRVWRRGEDGEFRVTLDWANSLPRPKTP